MGGSWTKSTSFGGLGYGTGTPPENIVTEAISLNAEARAEQRVICPTPFEYWKMMKRFMLAAVAMGGLIPRSSRAHPRGIHLTPT
jgi:hypothetical protein